MGSRPNYTAWTGLTAERLGGMIDNSVLKHVWDLCKRTKQFEAGEFKAERMQKQAKECELNSKLKTDDNEKKVEQKASQQIMCFTSVLVRLGAYLLHDKRIVVDLFVCVVSLSFAGLPLFL